MFYLENINFLNMYIRKGEINIFKQGGCTKISLNLFTKSSEFECYLFNYGLASQL